MSEDQSSSSSSARPVSNNRPLHETLLPAVTLPVSALGKRNMAAVSSPPRGLNGTWRSNSDMAQRRVIVKEIVKSIHRRRPNAPQSFKKQLPSMVQRLEEALYKNAPSMEVYADLSTLEQRLETLARKVQQQAAVMKQQQHSK
ncbi:unnamed protein product [Cylindrotheca closterium]|uniref:Mediator complex subunit 15 KIX domain-containing protein n=1 Tax=Cylindrotheca closterium TaxID=2856 RepID=A0AAD2G1Y8_9STRA|nr:unnamed protein product [Cylindrotheca closterium]